MICKLIFYLLFFLILEICSGVIVVVDFLFGGGEIWLMNNFGLGKFVFFFCDFGVDFRLVDFGFVYVL